MLSYDPGNKTIVILKIPDDTYFDLPKGFGSWRVGSIYGLGQEEKPPVGAELLKESLAKLLGLPIDGYISLKSSVSIDQEVSSLHKNPASIVPFIGSIQTDLTPLETLNLLHSLSSVRSDKVTTLDIANSNLTESKLLPDQERVLGIDSISFDLFVRKYMADSTMVNEGVSVGVFNATDHPGIGADVARIVTNMGGNVIFVTNTDNTLGKTIVTSSKSSLTSQRLIQVFAPWCSNCKSADERVIDSRAEVNIVLGEDYYKDHYQR